MTDDTTTTSATEPADPLKPVADGASDVRVYEFGIRLDQECVAAADEQVRKARVLYNDIVACMRRVYDEMQAWVMERAGDDGQRIQSLVNALNERFAAAKAANDEPAMKAVAAERREAWKAQSACLGAVRKQHANDLRTLFYSRIGAGRLPLELLHRRHDGTRLDRSCPPPWDRGTRWSAVVAGSMPHNRRSRVLLPAPLGPIKPTNSPRCTCKLISRRMATPSTENASDFPSNNAAPLMTSSSACAKSDRGRKARRPAP